MHNVPILSQFHNAVVALNGLNKSYDECSSYSRVLKYIDLLTLKRRYTFFLNTFWNTHLMKYCKLQLFPNMFFQKKLHRQG